VLNYLFECAGFCWRTHEEKAHLKRIILVLIVVAMPLLYSGCVSSSIPPTPGPAQIPSPNFSPIATVASFTSPLPVEVPSPAPGQSTVKGQLLSIDHKPVTGVLYLARAVQSNQPNYPPLIALSENTDPKAEVNDKTGSFAFSNVAPGSYALMLWGPLGSSILSRADSGDLILVEPKANETVDLGVVVVK
jgi:hypothetical protein